MRTFHYQALLGPASQTAVIAIIAAGSMIIPARVLSDSPPSGPCQAAAEGLARRFINRSADLAFRGVAAIARADEIITDLSKNFVRALTGKLTPKDIKNFDPRKFDDAVKFYEHQFKLGQELTEEQIQLIRGAASTTHSIERQLALVHVVEKHAQALKGVENASSTVKDLLAKSTLAQKRALDDLANEIAALNKYPDRLPRPDQVRDWMVRLYEIKNLPPSFLAEVRNLGKSEAVRIASARIIDNVIENADDVYKAFEKMGLVEATAKSGTKAARAKSIVTRIISEASMNAGVFYNKFLAHLPKINRTQAQIFTNYVRKGLAEGKSLAEMRPALERLIGRGANFDALYNAFRGMHNLAWKAYFAMNAREIWNRMTSDKEDAEEKNKQDLLGQDNLRSDEQMLKENANDEDFNDALKIFLQDFGSENQESQASQGSQESNQSRSPTSNPTPANDAKK